MSDYMTPIIGAVIAQLSQTCDDLTRQELIKALTAKTQEWCAGDPDFAETIHEGKKTLEGCVKYVTERAMEITAKNFATLTKTEVDALPTKTINGKKGAFYGGMVGAEKVFEWARDYYTKAEVEKTANTKTKTDNTKGKGKKNGSDKSTAKAKTDALPPADKPKEDLPEQMMLGMAENAAA